MVERPELLCMNNGWPQIRRQKYCQNAKHRRIHLIVLDILINSGYHNQEAISCNYPISIGRGGNGVVGKNSADKTLHYLYDDWDKIDEFVKRKSVETKTIPIGVKNIDIKKPLFIKLSTQLEQTLLYLDELRNMARTSHQTKANHAKLDFHIDRKTFSGMIDVGEHMVTTIRSCLRPDLEVLISELSSRINKINSQFGADSSFYTRNKNTEVFSSDPRVTESKQQRSNARAAELAAQMGPHPEDEDGLEQDKTQDDEPTIERMGD
jgi:hypothetical protein